MSTTDSQPHPGRGAPLPGSPPRVIDLGDDDYPPLLQEIHDPPARLYVHGDPLALARPQVAIVGSRRASAAGSRLAHSLAADLVEAGLVVCSGLARGIDGAAHRGAAEAGGSTVAVMATGIDRVYPPRHRDLAGTIRRGGCLVTEFRPGMPPLAHNFPRRNRIISGLSLGVVVVEAAPLSGSLITARLALEQGREVFALPWSPLHPGGRGCLQLLRDGAKMVEGVDHVLEELGPLYQRHRERAAGSAPAPAATGDAWLLPLLGYEPVDLDTLAGLSGRPAAEILAGLSRLEMAGAVVRAAGGYQRP
jgi:DNA processing protein